MPEAKKKPLGPPTRLEKGILEVIRFERVDEAERALEGALERLRLSKTEIVLGISTVAIQ